MKLKFISLIILAVFFGAFPASAQSTVGSWSMLPSMGTTFTQVVETPQRTYLLAGGSLMSFDDDGETMYYNIRNSLSDSDINVIRYNKEKSYLFIGYTNGNIDLLYDDGHVANMPDIKDAVLTTSHIVHDADFGKDRIVVTTDFGIVVFNDVRHEVVESGMYDRKLDYAFIIGDTLVVIYDNNTYTSPLGERHTRLDQFIKVEGQPLIYCTDAERVNENTIVYVNNKTLNTRVYQAETNTMVPGSSALATDIGGTSLIPMLEGVSVSSSSEIVFVAPDLTVSRKTLPDALKNRTNFATGGAPSVWSAGSDGVAHYDISSSTPTVLSAAFRPQAVSVSKPVYLVWSADGSRLYFGNLFYSWTYEFLNDQTVVQETAYYDLEKGIKDISDAKISKVTRFVVDSDNRRVFVGSQSGLSVQEDGKQILRINTSNSPMATNAVHGCDFDPQGNLWILNWATPSNCIVLPADKVKQIPNITKDDFVKPILPEFTGSADMKALFCRHSDYALIKSSYYFGGYVILSHKGTYLDFSDDESIHHPSIIDQSGSAAQIARVTVAVEDQNGQIWMGTPAGVVYIPNPASAMSPNFTLTRPMVARNDGTNFGDYLLSSDNILDIAVDHTNRKWIATESSGLYLVSSDGTEIIENFTTDNSPLPSNRVLSVSVDPNGNEVFVGTEYGVFIYSGTSSPAAEDYSDVYAFPNPVRPDYTGWITITGLMDGSLVKIADVAGNVIYQGTSEGGSMVWDGCNSSGERVRTGVYFVLASQNQNGSSGVVTKIMVVN